MQTESLLRAAESHILKQEFLFLLFCSVSFVVL